jgi:hypothetical protein
MKKIWIVLLLSLCTPSIKSDDFLPEQFVGGLVSIGGTILVGCVAACYIAQRQSNGTHYPVWQLGKKVAFPLAIAAGGALFRFGKIKITFS